MGLSAFGARGAFYRGNIHTHSNASDGALPAEAVCRHYAEAGYDFLCLSDHFLERYGFPITDTRPYRTNRFTTILGAEIHAPANSHGEIWHLLACGLPEDFEPLGEGEGAVALAERAVASGAFLGIAHPQWSSLTIEDGREMARLADAVEIYNHTSQIECGRGDGASLLDLLLNEGYRLDAYAADDAHFQTPDAGGGWMMVKAETNEPEALLAAMKAGDYYSSQGPQIFDFSTDGKEAFVDCSPAAMVAVVGRGSRSVARIGDGMPGARLDLSRFAGDWFRLVVGDDKGRLAWTNPVWLEARPERAGAIA